MKSPYALFDLPRSATPEQVRARYKQLIRIYHPDRFPNSTDKAYAEERLKAINEAYAEIGPTVHHRRPTLFGKRATGPSPTAKSTPSNEPVPAPSSITPFVQMRRVVQNVVMTGGIILTGLAAAPLFSSSPTPLDALWQLAPGRSADLQTTPQAQPTALRQAPVDWVPITSPGGRQVVYVLRQEGTELLYARDGRSGRLRQVIQEGVYSNSFVWSPDENKLAFIARSPEQEQLHILDLPSARTEPIAEAGKPDQLRQYHWSANGTFTQ